jgi:hypothetical protein
LIAGRIADQGLRLLIPGLSALSSPQQLRVLRAVRPVFGSVSGTSATATVWISGNAGRTKRWTAEGGGHSCKRDANAFASASSLFIFQLIHVGVVMASRRAAQPGCPKHRKGPARALSSTHGALQELGKPSTTAVARIPNIWRLNGSGGLYYHTATPTPEGCVVSILKLAPSGPRSQVVRGLKQALRDHLEAVRSRSIADGNSMTPDPARRWHRAPSATTPGS